MTNIAAPMLGLLLLAGCMPPPPARQDPLLSVGGMGGQVANEDLKRARVAVLVSENTRKSAEYIRAFNAKAARWGAQTIDETTATRALLDKLKEAFGGVSVIESPGQAAMSGAHLIGVADVYAKIGGRSGKASTTELAVHFQRPDMTPVAVVRGFGSRTVPFPATTTNWEPSAAAAGVSFAMALSTNTELAAFAAALPPVVAVAPAAAPAAAPAPAAPAYRSEVESPGYRLPEDASKFALVVGVEKYQGLPPAEHATRDAKAVKAHLLAAGYPERNIVYLVDAQAGKSGLEKHLDAWLPKNVDEGSTLFVYFSGHGAPDPEKGDAYLMPWDGDAKFVESTGYPVKRLYEKLSALKAKRVLVAMDACFSGAGGRSVLAKGTRPLVAKVDLGDAALGRISALTAADADEVTGTDAASGHGLFTYHLLKGLTAKGGRASFQDLYDYLTPKVRDAARRDNRDQTPRLLGHGGASL